MKKKFYKGIIFSLLSIMMLLLSACSDQNVKNDTKQKELLSEVITKLCTVPDEKLQKAYTEAKAEAERAASETTEPGAYGVYDYENLLKEMYGEYFTDQGIESIPYWIYTNLNAYSVDRNISVSVKDVEIGSKESSEGDYYTFTAQLFYTVNEEKYEYGQKGTALFEDGKIKNIHFDEGFMTKIESYLFDF